MEYDQILFESRDKVAVITLNRPEKLNAWTKTMDMEVRDALLKVERDGDFRVSIITGAGRGFCAGTDLSDESDASHSHEKKEILPGDEKYHRMTGLKFAYSLKKPVIVAINGPAVGVGVTMFLPHDIRIAAESAKMGIVFTRRGIVPEVGCAWLLPRIIGISKATELMLSGRTLKAREALEYGLVSRVVPDNQLMETAIDLAVEISTNASPVCVALTKSMIQRFQFADSVDEVDEINLEYFGWSFSQPDATEGIVSFLEKRPPDWKMEVPRDLPDFVPNKP